MAKLEIELSEFDAVREAKFQALKDLDAAKEEIKLLKESHLKEVEDFKKGAKVLIKQPIVKTEIVSLNSEIIDRIVGRIYGGTGRGFSSPTALRDVISDTVRSYGGGHSMEYAVPNSDKWGNGRRGISETIETLVGFDEVETEVRAHLNALYSEDIARYQSYIKVKEEIEKEYKVKLEKEVTKAQDKFDDIIGKNKENNQKDIEFLTKRFEDDIKALEEKHALEIKRITPSLTLEEVLDSHGYLLKKSVFKGMTIVKK